MLELIVLGQIPGTQFQITLSWLLLCVLAGLVVFDVKIHNPSLLNIKHKKSTRKS